MAYAITQNCCNDASCVSACPVNCIHPTPDEPEFGTTDLLYIDPRTCIDCGACADACPVDAIRPVDLLSGPDLGYADLNRRYYDGRPADGLSDPTTWGAPQFPRALPRDLAAPRVAVVGTGPAAGYTVHALLRSTEAEITVLDRLAVPGGLVRFGVAPDHPATKRIGHTFAAAYRHPRVRLRLGVEVGRDVEHAELAAQHHAVIYAVGAPGNRSLDIPGEHVPGSIPATEFVGWYNAHPDIPADAVDLDAERAVIVGNGNVALDIARILLTDPEALAHTDIAEHALAALRTSKVREVVLLARRGPEHVAFTRPEWLALQHLPEVDVVVDEHGDVAAAISAADPDTTAGMLRDVPVRPVDWDVPPAPGNRLVLRFSSAPTEIVGAERVHGVVVGDTDGTRKLATGLVIRAVGWCGVPVPGLPFDSATGTMPHTAGRVEPGTYVVGWAKRGGTGGIGSNRACATETINSFLDDAAAGLLSAPSTDRRGFDRLLRTLGRSVRG